MHICIMSVLFVHKGVKLQQVSNKSPKYNPNVEMNHTGPQALFDRRFHCETDLASH